MQFMSTVRAVIFLSCVLFCASCSSTRLPNTQALYSQPIVASPHSPSFVKQLKPSHVFGSNENHPSMLFCEFSEGSGADDNSRPVILIWQNGAWQTIDFSAPQFEHNFWSVVCCARNSPFIWGVLEFGHEGLGPDVQIVFSDNGGRSWTHIASLAKPTYLSYSHSLRMDSTGTGHLIIYLDDDYGGVGTPGYHTYETKDWGKTWFYESFAEDIFEAPFYKGSESNPLEQLMKDFSEKK